MLSRPVVSFSFDFPSGDSVPKGIKGVMRAYIGDISGDILLISSRLSWGQIRISYLVSGISYLGKPTAIDDLKFMIYD